MACAGPVAASGLAGVGVIGVECVGVGAVGLGFGAVPRATGVAEWVVPLVVLVGGVLVAVLACNCACAWSIGLVILI